MWVGSVRNNFNNKTVRSNLAKRSKFVSVSFEIQYFVSDGKLYAEKYGKPEAFMTYTTNDGTLINLTPAGDRIIKFWEQKSTQFPTLAPMALTLLRMSASTSNLERVFSKVKDMLPTKRNALKSSTVLSLLQTANQDEFLRVLTKATE